jgi:hypothetical protein
MRLESVLPLVCAATFAVGACSSGDAAGRAQQAPRPSPVGSVERGDPEDHKERKRVRFSLRVAPGIAPATRKTVSAFLSFAAEPTAARAARLPSAASLLLRVDDARPKLQHSDLRQPSAWFVSNGEGTTSALFVISNSIANSQDDGVEFLASPRLIPLCNLSQDGAEDVQEESVYITLEPRGGCVEGFRIRLNVDSSATIRAVELAVRAP